MYEVKRVKPLDSPGGKFVTLNKWYKLTIIEDKFFIENDEHALYQIFPTPIGKHWHIRKISNIPGEVYKRANFTNSIASAVRRGVHLDLWEDTVLASGAKVDYPNLDKIDSPEVNVVYEVKRIGSLYSPSDEFIEPNKWHELTITENAFLVEVRHGTCAILPSTTGGHWYIRKVSDLPGEVYIHTNFTTSIAKRIKAGLKLNLWRSTVPEARAEAEHLRLDKIESPEVNVVYVSAEQPYNGKIVHIKSKLFLDEDEGKFYARHLNEFVPVNIADPLTKLQMRVDENSYVCPPIDKSKLISNHYLCITKIDRVFMVNSAAPSGAAMHVERDKHMSEAFNAEGTVTGRLPDKCSDRMIGTSNPWAQMLPRFDHEYAFKGTAKHEAKLLQDACYAELEERVLARLANGLSVTCPVNQYFETSDKPLEITNPKTEESKTMKAITIQTRTEINGRDLTVLSVDDLMQYIEEEEAKIKRAENLPDTGNVKKLIKQYESNVSKLSEFLDNKLEADV